MLLVVGNPAALTSSDTWLQSRLTAAGWSVSVGDDDVVTSGSASGKQLVVLSESVTPAGIGTKFTAVPVPLISAEPFLYDELGMTGTGTNQGGTSGSTETLLTVTPAGVQSGLGGGLSAGNTTIASSGVDLSWGRPAVTATIAATIAGDATKATLFGYPTGTAMVTGTAPAARVGWTHYTGSAAPLNGTAVALFNAALAWAAPTSAMTTVTYVRDVTDRIIARKVNGTLTACYSYTGGGDTADQTLAPAGATCSATVMETVRGLPGGASLTSRGSATTDVWSLSNIHGDTLATVNGGGVKQGATLTYTPDGQALGALADNSAGAFDNDWLGTHQRPLEHQNNLQPTIEMGARPYNPTLGRFLEIDPIEGGNDNDYNYVTDPINQFDLDGRCGLGNPFKKCGRNHRGGTNLLSGFRDKGMKPIGRRAWTNGLGEHWRGGVQVLAAVGAAACLIGSGGTATALCAAGYVAVAADLGRSYHDNVWRRQQAGRKPCWGNFGLDFALAGVGLGASTGLGIVTKAGARSSPEMTGFFRSVSAAQAGTLSSASSAASQSC